MAGVGALLQRLLFPGPPEQEPLLVRLQEAGTGFRRVVFTRNRRVMISVGDGGATLRVHERFREAPLEVQQAVAGLFPPAPPRERARARSRVQAFLRDAPREPARPRPRRIPPADRPHVQRLRAEFDRVNREYFGGALPSVPIALSGRMRRRNGHFATHPLEIVISRTLCNEAVAGEAEQTLRHEMIHLWQHVQGGRPDHGPEFRRWAQRLGVHPRATRTVQWKCASRAAPERVVRGRVAR